jgi:hypothetical protein
MMLHSHKELRHFATCLHEAGVLDAAALDHAPPAPA